MRRFVKVFKIVWRWLIHVPLAIITAYNLFRQEIVTNLPPIVRILPNWHWAIWLSIMLVAIIIDLSWQLYMKSDREKTPEPKIVGGRGGRGGKARVGGNGIAIGGPGGRGGVGGDGGDGGDSESDGDGLSMGGEGGEAGQIGRGGRGGRSPLEILGYPNEKLSDGTWLWEKGRGGDGGGPIRLNMIVGKRFVDEIILVDGNHYTDCTFENCKMRWNGGPWKYKNIEYVNLGFESQNTIVTDTINILKSFGFLEEDFARSWQMRPKEYFQDDNL